MTYVNSAGSHQKARTRLKIGVTAYDAARGRFVTHGMTIDVHGRWTQAILDCLCDAESQQAALAAPLRRDGSQAFVLSADAMRETRSKIIEGAECALSEESALDGRVRTILREAIGLCDLMVVGICVVSVTP